MPFLKKNLNILAMVLIAAALATWFVWPHKTTLLAALGATGLLSLAVYAALNLASLKRSFVRKSFLYSGNLILVVLIVLAILVLVNVFLAKHHHRIDFTSAKIHSLSDQSITILQNLQDEVRFKSFFRDGTPGRSSAEDLLELYAYHSRKVRFEFVDPDKNPAIVKSLGITQDATTIIEVGGRETRITTMSEEDVTNALIRATRSRKKVICFLEGHGELSIEETGDSGLSTVKAELEKLGYEVRKLSLALADRFPEDCDLLVIPGPRKDLLPNEYETIRAYLDRAGGRAMFLVDPITPTLLPIFLDEYGFRLENDIIVDSVSRLLGGDYFIPVVTSFEAHAITDKLSGYACFFPLARSVELTEDEPDGATMTILAKTSPNAYAKRDFELRSQMTVEDIAFVAGRDVHGPIGLAAVTVITPKAPEDTSEAEGDETSGPDPEGLQKTAEKEGREARVAVVGDSDFINNRHFSWSGNGDLFLNVANWLTEETDLISIQTKTQSSRTVRLSPVRMSLIALVGRYILPFGVLIFGLVLWLRRRSL